jgi:MYXO-CTERM domain-containing protein
VVDSLTYGDGVLYIDNSNASTIERYDAATGSFLSSFYIRSVVDSLTYGDGILYIDNSNASTIERYDAATGSFLSSFYIRPVVDDLAYGPSNGVPLVNTLALFGLGLAGIGAVRRRRTLS